MAGQPPLNLLAAPPLPGDSALFTAAAAAGVSNTEIQPGVEKLYKCEYCAKEFKKSSTLSHHIRVHTGEKPYKCDHCDRRFMQQSHLVGHLRSHTGDRPYKCGFCHRGFFTASHLTQHSKIHTGEKSFKCDFCNQFFSQYATLAEHVRTHSKPRPFKCDYCDKGFTSSSNLTKHKRIHTKPCKCPVCNKGFVRNSEVTRHMRTHVVSEKPTVTTTSPTAAVAPMPYVGAHTTDFFRPYTQQNILLPEMATIASAAVSTTENTNPSSDQQILRPNSVQHFELNRTLLPVSFRLAP